MEIAMQKCVGRVNLNKIDSDATHAQRLPCRTVELIFHRGTVKKRAEQREAKHQNIKLKLKEHTKNHSPRNRH
jgi:hypothetical protein